MRLSETLSLSFSRLIKISHQEDLGHPDRKSNEKMKIHIEGFSKNNAIADKENEVSTNRLLSHDLRVREPDKNAELTSTERSSRNNRSAKTGQSNFGKTKTRLADT